MNPFMATADIPPWYIGGYWALPLQWLVNAVVNNEFQDGEPADPLLDYQPWNIPNFLYTDVCLSSTGCNLVQFRGARILP